MRCGRWARVATAYADVRLIAATHRDLRAAVAEGRVREDLYYRLRRVVLAVPPLRARLDDLPLLVEHVRRQVTARHGLSIEHVADGALDRLARYPWPGNVRELEAVLEEAMVLRGGGVLRAEDLALPEAATEGPTPANASTAARPAEARRRLALALAAADAGVSTSELARAASVGLALARRELGALVSAGALRRTGAGRAVRYVR